MSVHSTGRPHRRLRFALLQACLVSGAVACGGPVDDAEAIAQTTGGEARTPAEYELTMPYLRQLVPAIHESAQQAEAECPEIAGRASSLGALGADGLARAFDECPPVRRRLAAADLSSEEAATAFLAFMQAYWALGRKQAAEEAGEEPPELSPVAAANVALVEANLDELMALEGN